MADGISPEIETPAVPAESPAVESPPESANIESISTPAKKIGAIRAAFRAAWTSTKRKADITWKFTKELFNDHTFWVKALAVKGGASAILVTGILGISAMVTMPLLVAATGITLSVGLIGVSLYGMAAGGMKAWEGVQDVYARATGRAPKEHMYVEKEDMFQRLAKTDFVKRMTDHKWAKTLAKTHAWKTTSKFMRNREDSVLGGIAVGGAALSLVVGAVALPLVAAGTLFTVATVFTVSSVISGISGLYFSITGLREESRMKREHRAKQKSAANAPKLTATELAPIGAPFIEAPALPLNKVLSEPFSQAAQTVVATILPPASNTNIQPPAAKNACNSSSVSKILPGR